MTVSMAVDLAPRRGLRLRNPVMTASGTFGYGVEYARLVDINRLGAIVCKGITLEPRIGNPSPRLAETPAGLLNSIGLENAGLQAVLREKAPIWATWDVPVVVNIAGETVEEYARMAEALEGVPGVAGLELNISCPNVDAGGMAFGSSADAAAEVTAAVRSACQQPLLVKLSPNVGDITEIALAVEAAGADALTLVNTFLGMVIDVNKRRPFLPRGVGGLSGPAIRPLAVRMVYEVARVVRIPIVGIGGITNAEDALQFLMAGATAVQVGTASFVNPRASLDVVEGLRAWAEVHGLQDIREIIGVAQQPAA